MPGLSQLKNFVNDITALGDEVAVRTARGETVEEVVFPASIMDIDDRDDFMAGIPETSGESADETDAAGEGAETSAESDSTDEDIKNIFDSLGLDNLDDSSENQADEPAADAGAFDLGELPDEDESPAVEQIDQFDDLGAMGAGEADSDAANIEANAEPEQMSGMDDFEMPDLGSFGGDDADGDMNFEEPAETGTSSAGDDFEMPDFGDLGDMDDFAGDSTEPADGTGFESDAKDEALPDFGDFGEPADMNATDFDLDDMSESNKGDIITENDTGSTESSDFDLPNFDDTSFDDTSESGGFELPEMNFGDDSAGADFGEEPAGDSSLNAFAGTDAAPADGESSDFNLDFSDLPDMSKPAPEGDDFAAEEGGADDEFVIAGFSDVADSAAAAKEEKAAKEKAEKAAAAAAEVPDENSNSLTDKEYQQFIENLNYYPLNLRVEIENMLIGNEFTDEENMRVVRMVVKKTAVQKLAHYMGNLLDKHIDVPRNYDKRTAAQYEAYKKTAEYQLKNRILPFAFACLVIFIFCASLLYLGKTFIYDPFRAELLYKEGYTLIENDYFPQSQEKFIEATKFKQKKHWFFDYADAYREKKQFGHARQMYRWILQCFPKDKRGGLKYAEMELYDLNNYEEAERVVRRHVLDNFINDPDGMLLLGDIYLEWACDKDPSKFELARQQYESVIDMYGQSDAYLARMLRYYVRTDNLAEVLPLKNYFYPDKKEGEKRMKALTPKDKLELSGYLLDKLYGQLSPAEEYLRQYITDVRALLELTIKDDPTMPEAYYNFARYFIYTANIATAQNQLEYALQVFDQAKTRTRDRILKNVDTYRLLGEIYKDQQEYLKAEELYTKGIALFENEKEASNLKTDINVGKLYADLADLDYFLSGDIDQALRNYLHAVENNNDNASVRYRIGYINYANRNYVDALAAFIKASESKGSDLHLLLSLGNVLALRDDNFAAQGYYERFVEEFARVRSLYSVMFPQVQQEHQDLVENYMYACNNYGVTLGNLAFRTGDSQMNAKGMVYLSESMRAWDALTRNQKTLVRLGGSNLAAQNMKYLSHRVSEYEPAMYFDIPRTLQDEEILTQPNAKK